MGGILCRRAVSNQFTHSQGSFVYSALLCSALNIAVLNIFLQTMMSLEDNFYALAKATGQRSVVLCDR